LLIPEIIAPKSILLIIILIGIFDTACKVCYISAVAVAQWLPGSIGRGSLDGWERPKQNGQTWNLQVGGVRVVRSMDSAVLLIGWHGRE
jgi:hypothetical protein